MCSEFNASCSDDRVRLVALIPLSEAEPLPGNQPLVVADLDGCSRNASIVPRKAAGCSTHG